MNKIKPSVALLKEINNIQNLEDGCFVWIPVMQKDSLHVLEVNRNPNNLSTHDEVSFEIKPLRKEHYNRTHKDQLPIKNLHLGENQELLINPSKRRLCLIISKHNIPDLTFINNSNQLEYAQHLSLESFIAVPAYSCSTSSEPTSFGPEITDRIKNFVFSHLFYLPKYQNTSNKNKMAAALSSLSNAGSIFRLDEMFSFNNNLSIKKENYKITQETQKILFIHLYAMFGNKSPLKQLRTIV